MRDSRLAGVVFLLAVGLIANFHPILRLGTNWYLGACEDVRLNHFFLEHGWRCLFDATYSPAFWSPGFFYPFRNALALSDNLVGSAPIYWASRAFAGPVSSLLLWVIACWILNYFSFYAALRSCRIDSMLSALGAFWYAFGLPRWS